jgi:hypothetical protein
MAFDTNDAEKRKNVGITEDDLEDVACDLWAN